MAENRFLAALRILPDNRLIGPTIVIVTPQYDLSIPFYMLLSKSIIYLDSLSYKAPAV